MAFRDNLRRWVTKGFNLSILKEKRFTWIDYLRGVAIILVVYHHVRVGIERSNIIVPQILVDANMIFYSFRMPLFFILSGIFISKAFQKKSATQIAWLKFETILYPYFIWAFIQVSLQIFLGEFTNSQRSAVDYTYILYHPRYLDQFWYLPALFNATMFYLLLKTHLNPSRGLHLSIGLVLYFLSPFMENISMISDWMQFYIFFCLGNIFSDLFFKPSTQNFFSNRYTLSLIIPLFIAVQIYYLKFDIGGKTLDFVSQMDYVFRGLNQIKFLVIALIGCISMIVLAFRMQHWNVLRFLRVLGYHSLYIYVLHVMVVGFIRLTLANFFGIRNPIILLVAGIFFGVLIPILFYNLIVRNNIGWFLFSFKKRKKESEIGSGNESAKDIQPGGTTPKNRLNSQTA